MSQSRSEEAQMIAALYREIKQERSTKGNLRGRRTCDIVGEKIQMSGSRVWRLVRIDQNLIPELKRLWDLDVITQAQAELLCGVDGWRQKAFYEIAKCSTARLSKNRFETVMALAAGEKVRRESEGSTKTTIQLQKCLSTMIAEGEKARKLQEKGGRISVESLERIGGIVAELHDGGVLE